MVDTVKTPSPSSPLLIAMAWAVVVIPTAWGLNYTVQNAFEDLLSSSSGSRFSNSYQVTSAGAGAASKKSRGKLIPK